MFLLALIIGGGRLWDAAAGSPEGAAPPFAATMEWTGAASQKIAAATLDLQAGHFIEGVAELLWGTFARLWNEGHTWFLLIFGLWTAAVTAVCGGALCRLEAVRVSTGDPPPLDPALGLAIGRWTAFFGALLIPIVLAAVLAIGLMVFGLILFNIPVLNILGGLLYGLALLVGLGLTLLMLGFAASYPLLLPAVAVENCDGPDALHRGIAYIIAKPLSWMLYLATLMLGLGLGLMLVTTIGQWTLDATTGLVAMWTNGEAMDAATAALAGVEAPPLQGTDVLVAPLVTFWSNMIQWAVAGWAIAYLMAGSTRAYLLLRRACDGLDERDIWWPGLIRGTLAPEPPVDSRSE